MGVRPDRCPAGSRRRRTAVAKLEAAWGANLAALPPACRSPTWCRPSKRAPSRPCTWSAPIRPGSGRRRAARKAALAKLDVPGGRRTRFPTDTAAAADVVLASAVAFEDEGTFTNGERFVQRVRAGGSAPRRQPARLDDRPEAGQRPRRRLGLRRPRPTSCARSSEVDPDYRGISYAKLDERRVQVPVRGRRVRRHSDPVRRRLRQRQGRVRPGRRQRLRSRPPTATSLLLTGSVKEHHATGVRTRRSPGSTNLVPEARLEINPADAASARCGRGRHGAASRRRRRRRRGGGGGHRPRPGRVRVPARLLGRRRR